MKYGENMQAKDNFDEEMLISKAKTLKNNDKTYKFLECIERVLKSDPYNPQAIIELAKYLKEGENV